MFYICSIQAKALLLD